MESLLATEMEIAGDDARRRATLTGEARRLLLPGEMGEVFKVIALGRGVDKPLGAFATQDLRASL
jgi:SAM-dependent MidA family methyltransferase